MLAIRLQRQGRSGHAQFRMVVQDSRLSPKSGKVVARLGSYNPHNKEVSFDKEKASYYLEHGAQPSPRVAVLLKSEGVKLPKWVNLPEKKTKAIKNADKLRKNRPAEEAKPTQAPAEEVANTAEPVNEEVPEVVEAEEAPTKAEPSETETPSEPPADQVEA